ncbi:HAD family phosphatase [Massilia sp. YMA4]|uniref:HAD family hydrolase n=1 Tax=Massilia sp. YMA4 TaxID=1593482 RepID=UPI001878EFFD|nr:HAD family phosphatase [Massilia sp. YMA4]
MRGTKMVDGGRLPGAAPVFWDLDGTLIHSDPVHDASILHACAAQGLALAALPPLPAGASGPEVYRALFGGAGDDGLPARYAAWYDATVDYVLAHLASAQPAASAVRFCRWLGSRGVAQTLVSNSHPRIIAAALEQLDLRHRFTHLCSGDEVAHPKPAPDVYLRAAALHGRAPAACVAFEDSANGIRAARAAGMAVIALSADPALHALAGQGFDPADEDAWRALQASWPVTGGLG